jgi:UDP-N-acetylmuramate: L-alanyl-gamma-D-glutamyl-meso-diaminopimelate ligase
MASEAAGAPLDRLIAALPGFRGTKRRQELVGITNGVHVYDDFAHHPTAVNETLSGFRERVGGRLIAVFEPRSATASRRLHQDTYPDAFASADVCILAPVGRSEVPSKEKLDTMRIADELVKRGKTARACASVDEAVATAVDVAKAGDTIVVMSNGRFDDAPDRILLGLVQLD